MRKIAPVTDASSGIGQATRQRLAKAGDRIPGTSRRAGTLGRRSPDLGAPRIGRP